MASGIKVLNEVIEDFKEMKAKKAHSYLIFRISDDLKSIKTDEKGTKGDRYDEFLEKLNDAKENKQGRYGVYDYIYEKDGQAKNKLIFVLWTPDELPVKQRMIYASSKQELQRSLGETGGFEHYGELADLAKDVIHEKVLKKDKV